MRGAAFYAACAGLLLFAVASATAAIDVTNGAAAESVVANPTDEAPALPPDADDFTPVACRMEPQCSINADCVVWCGPTGGHCVHHSCPVRICKCN